MVALRNGGCFLRLLKTKYRCECRFGCTFARDDVYRLLPLFQRKGECKAIDKKMIFFILMEMKRIFTRKVLRLASFTN